MRCDLTVSHEVKMKGFEDITEESMMRDYDEVAVDEMLLSNGDKRQSAVKESERCNTQSHCTSMRIYVFKKRKRLGTPLVEGTGE